MLLMSGSYSVLKTSASEQVLIEVKDVNAADATHSAWMGTVSKEFQPHPVTFLPPAGALRCGSDGLPVSCDMPDRTGRQWTPAHEVYTRDGLDATICSENAGTFRELVAQLRSPMGVVPFVGAGLSKP